MRTPHAAHPRPTPKNARPATARRRPILLAALCLAFAGSATSAAVPAPSLNVPATAHGQYSVQYTVSWPNNPHSFEDTYTLQESSNGGASWQTVADAVTVLSKSFTKTVPGARSYRLRHCITPLPGDGGGAPVCSPWSAVKTVNATIQYVRRPVVFVPGTMATAFNGSPGQYNIDTQRVWMDLDFSRPWDIIKDSEVEAYFKLEHKAGSSTADPVMDRGGGRSVSYIGTAASGYFNGLVDYDLVGTRLHLDLRDAFVAQGYVPNQSLFLLRYDWVQDWDLACPRLSSLIDEARAKSGADKVFLVGHSQGTQVIDYCLIRAAGASALRGRTAGVVHFAPPTHGGEARNLYANIAGAGLGRGQDWEIYARISASTSRKIMRSSPAIYMMRPDWIFEREIQNVFPWIVGSYAEFRDDYVCTAYCTYFGGNTPPPQYTLAHRTLQVPSSPNASFVARESQISQRMYDQILAPWSLAQKYDLNLASNRHSLPQLTFRGSGISTPVQYSVHHHTYDTVRNDFPMPAKSSSVVYGTGDGSVPAVSTYDQRSWSNTNHIYGSNLSATSGCDDRDHLEMFQGSCANEKVGRIATWIGSVGTYSGSTTTTSSALIKQAGVEIADTLADGTTKAETAWRNLSFFVPVPSSGGKHAEAAAQVLATVTMPDEGETVILAVQDDGEIAFVSNEAGDEKRLSAARGRRVFTERVPSTQRGVDLVHVSIQVPLADGVAVQNAGTSIEFAQSAGQVLLMSEEVAAATGERRRDAPAVFGADAQAKRGSDGGLKFAIGSDGAALQY